MGCRADLAKMAGKQGIGGGECRVGSGIDDCCIYVTQSDAVRNRSDAMIRGGIQNSLDAVPDKSANASF